MLIKYPLIYYKIFNNFNVGEAHERPDDNFLMDFPTSLWT